MGLWNRLTGSKKKIESDTDRAEAKEFGIFVNENEALATRVQLLQKLDELLRKSIYYDDKSKKLSSLNSLQKLMEKLYIVDDILRQVGYAWGRAGSDLRFAIAIVAWEKLLPYGNKNINAIMRVIQRIEKVENGDSKEETIALDVQDRINKCEHFIEGTILPRGRMLIAFSFKELDVSQLKTIVIHSVTPPRPEGYGGIYPADRGVQPYPQIPQEPQS